jgi:hypothetical protein
MYVATLGKDGWGSNVQHMSYYAESRMIDVPVPELSQYMLELESAESPRGKHEATGIPDLTNRVAIGGPYAVPVTAEYVAGDPGLRAFVESEAARFTYHLVHMSASFAEAPGGPRLDSATLTLKLAAPAGHPEPVAWSMAPLQVTDTVQVERRLTLGPQLKLLDVEVSAGQFEQTTSWQRTEVFLQAQRELRSDPGWEFRHTRTMRLYGSFRLTMVVRAASNQHMHISGTVLAATRGNMLRRYRSALPASPPLEADV